jgi:uncharacterized membrane protein
MIAYLAARTRQFLRQGHVNRKQLVYGLFILVALLTSSIWLANISPYTKSSGIEYLRAKVVSVGYSQSDIYSARSQHIQAKILDGEDKGRIVSVSRSLEYGDASYKRLPIGSEILVIKNIGNGTEYNLGDRWHIRGAVTLFSLMLLLVMVVGRWRGLTSVLGLIISIGVLSVFILPRIVSGHDAYATCIEGAFLITVVSLFVAHGTNKRTTIAFVSSIVTLLGVLGLVGLATYITGTSENITESTVGILYSTHATSLSGLFTGGIIIASLGVLYDITTGQAAAIDEIYKADRKQPALHLYRKGLSVGREHIAALVNTLALVYVGVALPSIVITLINDHVPVSVALNSEAFIEEVVRTCVASMGMLLAVPITTGLAAYLLPKWYSHKKPGKD